MTTENGVTEPEADYSSWVATPKETQPKVRWCPSHRQYEINPPGRLLCGLAWKELYQMEREVDAEKRSPNVAILALVDQLGELVAEMRYSGIIADPPPRPKPEPSKPPYLPPPAYPRQRGKGGVALP